MIPRLTVARGLTVTIVTPSPTDTLGRRGNASVSPVPERLTVALLAKAAVVSRFALLGRPYCDLGSCVHGVEYST